MAVLYKVRCKMKSYTVERDNGHVISVSEYGNSEGTPVLHFHGGPGGASSPSHARRFDLNTYRVILFDQRGCGKSTPIGKIDCNTTDDTIADAENIREILGIDRWFVAGGSWGSTLSLVYAIRHPERVRGLLLTAVFLSDRDTVKWAMTTDRGVARLMPDVWARRMAFFKHFGIGLETHNQDLMRALDEADENTKKELAAGVADWEENLLSPEIEVNYKDPMEITEKDIASARIFSYYEMHDDFLPKNYILDRTENIAHIPAIIVHGRYDILCPVEKAFLLKEHLPRSNLIIVPSSGHSMTAEGEMIRRMAFNHFLERNSA